MQEKYRDWINPILKDLRKKLIPVIYDFASSIKEYPLSKDIEQFIANDINSTHNKTQIMKKIFSFDVYKSVKLILKFWKGFKGFYNLSDYYYQLFRELEFTRNDDAHYTEWDIGRIFRHHQTLMDIIKIKSLKFDQNYINSKEIQFLEIFKEEFINHFKGELKMDLEENKNNLEKKDENNCLDSKVVKGIDNEINMEPNIANQEQEEKSLTLSKVILDFYTLLKFANNKFLSYHIHNIIKLSDIKFTMDNLFVNNNDDYKGFGRQGKINNFFDILINIESLIIKIENKDAFKYYIKLRSQIQDLIPQEFKIVSNFDINDLQYYLSINDDTFADFLDDNNSSDISIENLNNSIAHLTKEFAYLIGNELNNMRYGGFEYELYDKKFDSLEMIDRFDKYLEKLKSFEGKKVSILISPGIIYKDKIYQKAKVLISKNQLGSDFIKFISNCLSEYNAENK